MKKIITAFVATIMLTATTQACLGGNLIQVISEDGETVIATYNINTGQLLAQNKSYSIEKINFYDQSVGEEYESVCVGENGNCTQLAEMDRQDIRVIYSTFSNGKVKHGSKVIESVSVGAHVATTRGMAKAMFDLLSPIACAKK